MAKLVSSIYSGAFTRAVNRDAAEALSHKKKKQKKNRRKKTQAEQRRVANQWFSSKRSR